MCPAVRRGSGARLGLRRCGGPRLLAGEWLVVLCNIALCFLLKLARRRRQLQIGISCSRLGPRSGGASSVTVGKLVEVLSGGFILLDGCTGASWHVSPIWIQFSRSFCYGQPAAVVLWWAWRTELVLLAGVGWRQRQLHGRRSMGIVPGRCAGTRLQFSSVGMGLLSGSQSPWMAMVLPVTLASSPVTLPGCGGGRVRAGAFEVDDEQGPRDLSTISFSLGVLCLIWWDSCSRVVCGGCMWLCTRICTVSVCYT